MSLESAEMVKYASNAFLAMKISYANEMARICERVPGVDVSKVMLGVGLDETSRSSPIPMTCARLHPSRLPAYS
jgi:UDP-glucose 6-dehydrogenase